MPCNVRQQLKLSSWRALGVALLPFVGLTSACGLATRGDGIDFEADCVLSTIEMTEDGFVGTVDASGPGVMILDGTRRLEFRRIGFDRPVVVLEIDRSHDGTSDDFLVDLSPLCPTG